MHQTLKTLACAAVAVALLAEPAYGYRLSGKKWPTGRATIAYQVDPVAYAAAIHSSMRNWESGAHFEFAPAFPKGLSSQCPVDDADYVNTLTFASEPCSTALDSVTTPAPGAAIQQVGPSGLMEGVGWGDAIAITFSLARGGVYVNSTIVVNTNINWGVYDGNLRPGVNDVKRVILHELGHFVGLDHEVGRPAIMAPNISNTYQLQADDRDGIRALYPR